MLEQVDIHSYIENYEQAISNDHEVIQNSSYTLHKKCNVSKVKFLVKQNHKNNIIKIGKNSNASFVVKITGNNNYLYIGNNCRLEGLTINIKGNNLSVIIGNNVTCSGNGLLAVGQNSPPTNANLLIGDDVMMAKNVSIFTSDNHPIYDMQTKQRINNPSKNVIIEPHVWLGQDVTVLKSVVVGACSIIGSAALVTKDIQRCALAAGAPAKLIKENVFWSRNESKVSKDEASKYINKFT